MTRLEVAAGLVKIASTTCAAACKRPMRRVKPIACAADPIKRACIVFPNRPTCYIAHASAVIHNHISCRFDVLNDDINHHNRIGVGTKNHITTNTLIFANNRLRGVTTLAV